MTESPSKDELKDLLDIQVFVGLNAKEYDLENLAWVRGRRSYVNGAYYHTDTDCSHFPYNDEYGVKVYPLSYVEDAYWLQPCSDCSKDE